jgi:FdhE protein
MVPVDWNDVSTRLGSLRQRYPEWRSVLLVWEDILRTLEEAVGAAAVPRPHPERPGAAPLLAGITLQVDARQVRRWLERLGRIAGKNAPADAAVLTRARLVKEDVLALLEAALCQEERRLASLAAAKTPPRGSPSALTSLAHLALVPLLQAWGQRLAPQVPPDWSYGYCPICGAWPALAEVRGLEHARRLRCARCGGDWRTAWLRCPYCGEADHRRLGVLMPAAPGVIGTVDTCSTCKGYLKTRTTLQALPAYVVALEELAMVELDMAALDRGFTRPAFPGYALTCRLSAQPWRLRAVFSQRG